MAPPIYTPVFSGAGNARHRGGKNCGRWSRIARLRFGTVTARRSTWTNWSTRFSGPSQSQRRLPSPSSSVCCACWSAGSSSSSCTGQDDLSRDSPRCSSLPEFRCWATGRLPIDTLDAVSRANWQVRRDGRPLPRTGEFGHVPIPMCAHTGQRRLACRPECQVPSRVHRQNGDMSECAVCTAGRRGQFVGTERSGVGEEALAVDSGHLGCIAGHPFQPSSAAPGTNRRAFREPE